MTQAARSRGGLAHVVGLFARVEGNAALEALEPQLYTALPELAEACGAQGGADEAFLVERVKQSAPHGLLVALRRIAWPLSTPETCSRPTSSRTARSSS